MHLIITGIRGIPASHGGFETFANKLALYLTQKGWKVTVFCQVNKGSKISHHQLNNIELIHVPVKSVNALSTAIFDFKCTLYILKKYTRDSCVLTLGYNTASFGVLYRLFRFTNIINMDGIEWKRKKWSFPLKVWLYLNERLACYIGTMLIADHPEIASHLQTRVSKDKIITIPYGAKRLEDVNDTLLKQFDLESGKYILVIARPEPENSLYEIVKAFSSVERGFNLVVLGEYNDSNSYCVKVKSVASNEVMFLGAIFVEDIIDCLRYHARFYIHGHTIGGTNPSLVEALGASSAVLAHDNKYNKWVAGNAGIYFKSIDECSKKIDYLCNDNATIEKLKENALTRHNLKYKWNGVLCLYEKLISTSMKPIDANMREQDEKG